LGPFSAAREAVPFHKTRVLAQILQAHRESSCCLATR
jgi:hypothetical protein